MNEMSLLAQGIMGYVWQWARSQKKVPNWLSWAAFGGLAVAVWFWVTPTAGVDVSTDWRKALCAVVSFILGVRGAASTSSDTKAAPATNSK